MEKNFYPDNFEQLLRETTDNFRMYPSNRVWHSIYNDLHPDRKWPSLLICLLFVSSVFYIGLTNKKEVATRGAVPGMHATTTARTPVLAGKLPGKSAPVSDLYVTDNRNMLTDIKDISPAIKDEFIIPSTQGNTSVGSYSKETSENKTAKTFTEKTAIREFIMDMNGINSATLIKNLTGNKTETGNTNKKLNPEKSKAAAAGLSPDEQEAEKAWIEDFAFHNKPWGSIWKSRLSYQVYATPSIGYRKLSKNTSFNNVISSSLVAGPATEADYKSAVSHVPAVNMELGGNVLYSLSGSVNLKVGVQFNYSNYNVNAYDLKHPTMTTLMLNDVNSGYPVLVSRPTTLANIEGVYSTKLNNNTYQVSLPLGADFKLAGNNTVKWFAGATIQPTYIAGGNAYLISSDLKNYVEGNDMLRTWNLNAGVETFITYKTKSGITLNAGPQFRYQFLSTLTNEYTYDEKLYNLGLKIGVISNF